ncbi:hypothetical protein J3R30DRAFT_3825510 [Lentinula aciculospora]|uniref:Uncharacterized protein n=1 Tax=Lentinula aciculospora TaxID=153920 RepID=A0A9W8ZXU2_9AGAR|nr:hypothetical protein J3R30DRAFT_3825510 [Lentinula aciculospora]
MYSLITIHKFFTAWILLVRCLGVIALPLTTSRACSSLRRSETSAITHTHSTVGIGRRVEGESRPNYDHHHAQIKPSLVILVVAIIQGVLIIRGVFGVAIRGRTMLHNLIDLEVSMKTPIPSYFIERLRILAEDMGSVPASGGGWIMGILDHLAETGQKPGSESNMSEEVELAVRLKIRKKEESLGIAFSCGEPYNKALTARYDQGENL